MKDKKGGVPVRTMDPARLPEVRARAVAARETDIGREIAVKLHQQVRGQSKEAAVSYWAAEKETLRQAILYHVSDEMSRLSGIAGQSLTDLHSRPWDAPSPIGLAWFDSPIGTSSDGYPIRAASWSVGPTDPALTQTIVSVNERASASTWIDDDGIAWAAWITFYTHPDDFEHPMALRTASGELVADWEATVAFGDVPIRTSTAIEWRTLLSAWLLMQQRVADIVDLALRPSTARKYGRRNYDRRPVRVVTMGAHCAHSPEADTSSRREYRHRWVVRGHWRNQWFPKQKRHVPMWIAPHVKGAPGAPFIAPQETVHAWK